MSYFLESQKSLLGKFYIQWLPKLLQLLHESVAAVLQKSDFSVNHE